MSAFLDVDSSSKEETQLAGSLFADVLQPKDLVLLVGDLGSGKTTFMTGVAGRLCPNEPVTSPTFTLVHRYEGRLDLLHADLWRLENPQEILDLGIWEDLDQGAAALVEWGERADEILGIPSFIIHFSSKAKESERQILFFSVSVESSTKDIKNIYKTIEAPEDSPNITCDTKYNERLYLLKDLLLAHEIDLKEKEILL